MEPAIWNVDAMPNLLGTSENIVTARELIPKVSRTKLTVYISAEKGSGSELIAQNIHKNSPYGKGPFIKINCTGDQSALEQSLFGYEKGAFNGATHSHPGKFEQANGGTLFFEEIGQLSSLLQVKLFRFLQNNKLERVGGTENIVTDLRVICSSGRDLEKLVKDQEFRDDLLHRLPMKVKIAPLRERKEDIPIIANSILKRLAEVHKKGIYGITPDAMETLSQYSWPVNVSELVHCLECAFFMTKEEKITPQTLPDFVCRQG